MSEFDANPADSPECQCYLMGDIGPSDRKVECHLMGDMYFLKKTSRRSGA